MRHLYLSALFCVFSIFLFGQQTNIDSLKLELKKLSTKNVNEIYNFCKSKIDESDLESYKYLVEFLLEKSNNKNDFKISALGNQLLSDKYQRVGKYDKSILYSNKSLRIAKNNLNDSLNIIFLNQKATVYKFFDKVDSSEYYFQKAIDLGLKSKQYSPLGYSYNGMASLKMNIGKYTESINMQLKCLSIASQHSLEYLEISSLINLGWLYINLENYDKTIEYLKDAQTRYFTHKESNKEQLCDIYRFMGLAHSRKGNLEEGNKLNKKALHCLEETGNLMLAADVTNTIGVNFIRNKQYRESIPFFKKLIHNAQSLKSKGLENYGIINLSSAYIETNNLIEGEKILLKILNDTINKEILPKDLEKVVYQNLSDLYDRGTNFKKSLHYHKKFKHLEDSLNQVNNVNEAIEIETKYQTEKKEKENLQLKAEKAQQAELLAKESKRKWQFGGGLATALIGLGVFTFYYRLNKKQKTVIENLQKELHHRVKNNLAIIDTFIEVVKDEFDDQAIGLKLTELQNRIDSINEVHKQLYTSDNVTNLNLKKYINSLANNVQQSFNVEHVIIDQSIDETLNISPEKSFPIGLIINEFVTNSYKYAFSENKGNIGIKIEEIGNKISLSLSDNGKGLSEDFSIANASTFGIRIMKLLTDQLNGSFNLTNDNGVKLHVEFPK
ncbi:histidine kinase dimerization/phosphoacceptor domain -containing protein [Olleya aquimaris]|uniref:histidine kinase n=1 Tax=Olleya aquimaris TaxID=639310 RepID=A0A327RQ65_9FLAO|nr:histidine kinase dimerization/phosphoacceptor domain -containing protein [Olleya aquimaris]RAJ17774.1 two-component sensor histidine kinase [Olleya aquimaris]